MTIPQHPITPPPKFVHTVQGRNWPAILGDFTLVGPTNNKGAWRWYELHRNGTVQRIKVDHQLRPVYE
jgi:hypothetical protein